MTQQSKHTPGPWHVEPEEWTEGRGLAICARDGVVAIIDREGNADTEDKANAHLLAASPEMYELLRHILTADGVPQSTAAGPMSRKDIAWLKTVYAEARRIKAAIVGEG